MKYTNKSLLILLLLGVVENNLLLAGNKQQTAQPSYSYTLIDPASTGQPRYGFTLFDAASTGNIKLASDIINNIGNTDINQTNASGQTPLAIASLYGHLNIVQLLLDHKADVNKGSNSGETPLVYAVRGRHLNIVKALLEHGAIDYDNKALSNTTNPEIKELLLKAEDDRYIQQKISKLTLVEAASSDNIDLAEKLISNGADINQTNSSGQTALAIASNYGFLGMAKMLLDHGADINKSSNYGETPLMYAAIADHLNIVNLLLSKKAEVNLKTTYGRTALQMVATTSTQAMSRHPYAVSIVKALLADGAIDYDDKALNETTDRRIKELLIEAKSKRS